jgi:site-specific recombinase XerD
MYNTGARVSEIIGGRRQDLDVKRQQSVHLNGKGRKERIIPLWKETAALRKWLEGSDQSATSHVFTNRYGEHLTRSGVRQRLRCAFQSAVLVCPSLKGRNATPHSFRHATALHLLHSGVDLSVIA